MKRIIAIIFAAIMMFSIIGCGSKNQENPENSENTKNTEYVFICMDSSGNPVEGVSLVVCSDTQCMIFETDDKGEVVCTELPEMAYEVHISDCPDGYSYEMDEVYTTSTTYETHIFTFTKD